jgi:tRNA (guanine37-N1)-methyltransferase
MKVPAVLLSGDHAKISRWRLEQAELRTEQRRPDLWKKYKKHHEDKP